MLYASSPLSVSLVVVLATITTVALVVLLHYEALDALSRKLGGLGNAHPRRKVLYGVYLLLLLHVAEIWLFGGVIWGLLHLPGAGHVNGMAAGPSLLDSVYLSAMTYTTVGFGDLTPAGAIRFLSGTEALTGLMLVTWSASFTYLEMERYWRSR